MTTTPRTLLADEHCRIEALGEPLFAAMRANDTPAAEVAWTALEQAILDHLDHEEMLVFPYVEREMPAVVASLRADHARIRALTGQLGVALDLHLVRLALLDQLRTFLRAHAKKEEEVLDEETEQRLPAGTIRTLLRRHHLRRSLGTHSAASPCSSPPVAARPPAPADRATMASGRDAHRART